MMKMKLPLATVVSIVIFMASILGSYYKGLAESKDYVDKNLDKVVEIVKQDTDELKETVQQNQIDLAVIKQIVVDKFGSPQQKEDAKKDK